MEGTVAIVAPLHFEVEDSRFDEYFDRVGSEECRNNIRTFQRVFVDVQGNSNVKVLISPGTKHEATFELLTLGGQAIL